MATTLKVHPDHVKRRVSHNNVCAKAVGDHTQDELRQLAIEAQKSKNPTLLNCFVDIPTLAELTEQKVTTEQAQVTKPLESVKAKAATS